MKCQIPGANIKVFGRAIHAIAKTGEDLYVESQKDGLAFRTINSSRSAFISFLFYPNFFTNYDLSDKEERTETATDEDDADPDDVHKCRVSLRVIEME